MDYTSVDYLIVGGGGAGGGRGYAAGGGAGGVITGSTLVETGAGSTFSVVIGAGGANNGICADWNGNEGGYSCFCCQIAYGGGGGSPITVTNHIQGTNSFGGGGGNGPELTCNGCVSRRSGYGGQLVTHYNAAALTLSNTPETIMVNGFRTIVFNSHGCSGGLAYSCSSPSCCRAGGGGGGASSAGQNASPACGGNGGNGITWFDNITCVAGGGGGGIRVDGICPGLGVYGGGIGGKASIGGDGCPNTGGGGGGAAFSSTERNGGNGGSGVVMFRYCGSTELFSGGTVTCCNGYVYHCITSSCTITGI